MHHKVDKGDAWLSETRARERGAFCERPLIAAVALKESQTDDQAATKHFCKTELVFRAVFQSHATLLEGKPILSPVCTPKQQPLPPRPYTQTHHK